MNHFPYETALFWIFALPLAGAIINGLAGRYADRSLVRAVGLGSVTLSFALAVACVVHLFGMDARTGGEGEAPRIIADVYRWFVISHPSVGPLPIDVRFVLDPLSAVMVLVVTGIGLLIHVYSAGYMADDPGYPRFFAYLNLFMASMLLLVLASNFPLMFVGWEGVGVCSYLLIGYWYETPSYAEAAKKAFIVNRIGDFAVIIGMLALAFGARSFEFSTINASAAGLLSNIAPTVPISIAVGAGLLVFFGCTGKSAQLPLYVWLPDAMAGPTPVSALIHAATMVTAGVYLCCRISPVFQVGEGTVLAIIAIVGSLTALLAASIALVQKDLKKILAYSTVSQLGFMFAAIGVGAFGAAMFHVVTHAFFKACLFLGAGSVMHAVGAHGDADVLELGGLRKKLPKTHATFAIASGALAGLPPLAGFFSKDEILAGAARMFAEGGDVAPTLHFVGVAVLVALGVAATLTAFYSFRAYFLVFAGEYRGAAHGYEAEPHESPDVMTIPLIVLAAGAVVVGFLGLPHGIAWGNAFEHWLEGVVPGQAFLAPVPAHATPTYVAMGVGLAAALVGLGIAYARYAGGQVPSAEPSNGFEKLLFDKWRVDELYARTIVDPLRSLSVIVAWVDRTFIDVLTTRGPALVTQATGFVASRMQNGVVHTYSLVLVCGLGAILGFFFYPHVRVDATVDEQAVHLEAGRGLGYEYRWDANADGTFDTGWDASANTYDVSREAAPIRGYMLVVEHARGGESVHRLGHEPIVLGDLGDEDREGAEAAPHLPAAIRFVGGKVHVRPNGHLFQASVPTGSGEDIELSPDARFALGATRFQVIPYVHVALEVRNVFRNVRRHTAEVVLRASEAPAGRAEVAEHDEGGAR